MRADSFRHPVDDGREIFVRRWRPDPGVAEQALVHVAHGLAEHGGRYERLAEALTPAGYVVYASDHRGHGDTATGRHDLGFLGDVDGFMRAMRDLEQLIIREKGQDPTLPLFLFGHSFGSFLTQALMSAHGSLLRGAILAGSDGKPPLLAQIGRLVARCERWRLGPKGNSELLRALSFGTFNKQFKPNRTQFDWLSRDESEVDKYIADPLCGFEATTQLWVDLLDGLAAISDPARQAAIPSDLAVLIIAGSEDPVGRNTRGPLQLFEAYRRAGLRDVRHKFYPVARHELLNETNRDEVTADVLTWLNEHLVDRAFPAARA